MRVEEVHFNHDINSATSDGVVHSRGRFWQPDPGTGVETRVAGEPGPEAFAATSTIIRREDILAHQVPKRSDELLAAYPVL